ncbi:MAG: hypothetical protein AB7Q00_11795 [Phycisphaerales bacterium]
MGRNMNTGATSNESRTLPARVIVRLASKGAGVLRLLSGSTGGHAWPGRRKGTFLLMVVGMLAVIGVLTLIYAGIGLSDRQKGGAIAKADRVENIPENVANYIAGVIGDDALDVEISPTSGTPPFVTTRAAFDYPSVNPQVVSVVTGANQARFTPTGSFWRDSTSATVVIPTLWRDTDPYLSPNAPSFLGDASDPMYNEPAHRRNRDWATLSLVSPDGRAVNLANLRGNFDAESGFGTGANGLPRISANLYKIGDAAGVARVSLGPAPRPWDVATGQRWLFRPAMDANYPASDPRNLLNMYADADGDGYLDAIWQELRDASNPLGVLNAISEDPQYRLFIATKVVDLSGLVNVNTAGDFVAPPELGHPVGSSPTEVSVRTLLQGGSTWDETAINGASGGYDGIFGLPATLDDYSNYDPQAALLIGGEAYRVLTMSRRAGVSAPLVGESPWETRPIYRGDGDGTTPDPLDDFKLFHTIDDPVTQWPFWDFLTPSGTTGAMSQAARREAYYNALEADNQGAVYRRDTSGNPVDVLWLGQFGSTDLLELMTRRGVNNDNVRSDLELAVSGRLDTLPDYSPLRDNRSHRAEFTMTTASPTGDASEQALQLAYSDIRRLLTTVSGAREIRAAAGASPDVLTSDDLRVDAATLLRFSQAKNPTQPTQDYVTQQPARQPIFGTADQRAENHSFNRIFTGYANALLPYSNEAGSWQDPTGSGAAEATLTYGGRGAEQAIYHAAWMTLNLFDSYDRNGEPSVYTLLLDGSARQNGLDPLEYPWWHAGHDLDLDYVSSAVDNAGRYRDPTQSRLAQRSRSDQTRAKAVDLIGVEAEPFLTAMTMITVYADSGTDDTGTPGPGNEVKIRGDVTKANDEFLFRVLAFQLTNPFNVDIDLGGYTTVDRTTGVGSWPDGVDVADPRFPTFDTFKDYHYIKFGGRTFPLVRLKEEPSAAGGGNLGITMNPIKIPAGETVVVYALSQIPSVILRDRLHPADSNITPAQYNDPLWFENTIIRRMIASTSEGVSNAYWIPEMMPDTTTAPGELGIAENSGRPSPRLIANTFKSGVGGSSNTGFNTFGQLIYKDTQAAPVEAENKTAQLWRTMRVPGTPEATIDGDPLGVNLESTDLLVDRLRAPTASNMDVRFADGDVTIQGTDAGSESGFAMSLFEWVRRPSDPNAGTGGGTIPLGAIPAYCLERKQVEASGNSWNSHGGENNVGATIPRSDFAGVAGAPSFQAWRASQIGNTLVPEVANAPRNQSNTSNPVNGKPSVAGVPFNAIYTEIPIDNNYFSADRFTRTPGVGESNPPPGKPTDSTRLRVVDMLMPLAIGPMHQPDALVPAEWASVGLTDTDVQWTTLSEALALSYGYERELGTLGADTSAVACDMFGATTVVDPSLVPQTDVIRPLDRGRLVLDDYVPFLDVDADANYTPGTDAQRAPATPLALNVLDLFTVRPPSLTRSRSGVVNMNTMPTPVARAVPMLSPDLDTAATPTDPSLPDMGGTQGQKRWWWVSSGGAGSTELTSSSDLATTLVAFRDKTTERFRQSSVSSGNVPVTGVPELVSFAEAAGVPLDQYNQLTARSVLTGVPGIREDAGFRTPGEIMLARARDLTNPTNTARATHNIDFLGYLPGDSSRKGVSFGLYEDPNNSSNLIPNAIRDDYEQKLAVAGGALGSLSTRSDVYGVWFIINGYTREDVDGLRTPGQPAASGSDAPMVPSLQKRFFMVVDRSNVVRRGDKPRILMLREVPL